jgi:hypothetical protein
LWHEQTQAQTGCDPMGVGFLLLRYISPPSCLSRNSTTTYFTGVLVPIKEQSRKGLLEDLYVIIGKEKRIFLLDKMEIVGDSGLNRATLQRLFPPTVRFIGPDEVIRRLENVQSAKILTIEGLLYTGSRTLFITRLDDNDAAE